jgi:hypothetical protein
MNQEERKVFDKYIKLSYELILLRNISHCAVLDKKQRDRLILLEKKINEDFLILVYKES